MKQTLPQPASGVQPAADLVLCPQQPPLPGLWHWPPSIALPSSQKSCSRKETQPIHHKPWLESILLPCFICECLSCMEWWAVQAAVVYTHDPPLQFL